MAQVGGCAAGLVAHIVRRYISPMGWMETWTSASSGPDCAGPSNFAPRAARRRCWGMLAYTWVASALEPFTWPARITIGVLGIGVLALAARAHRRRVTLRHWWLTWRAALRHDGAQRTGRSPLAWRTATLVWGGLILAVAIWELTAAVRP
jgi:hypothetical protein